MRKLTTALATMALASTFAQGAPAKLEVKPFPMDATGHVVFTGVVEAPGVTAADLYSRAKLWTTGESFLTAGEGVHNIILGDDPASGVLVVRTQLTYTGNFARTTIEVKDGRYRWKVDQLMAGNDGSAIPYELMLTPEGIGNDWQALRGACEGDRLLLLATISKLKAAMAAAPAKW